jgi:hypothetical protein
VSANGTNARQVTPNEMDVVLVSWDSDPDIIYTACYVNNNDEICRLNLQTLQIEQLSNMTTAFPNAENPFVSSLDVSHEGEVIFSYGVTDSSIYQLNVMDGSVTLISSAMGDNFELLGWIDAPPDTTCSTTNPASYQNG